MAGESLHSLSCSAASHLWAPCSVLGTVLGSEAAAVTVGTGSGLVGAVLQWTHGQ